MSDTLFPKGGPNPSGAYFTGQRRRIQQTALSSKGVRENGYGEDIPGPWRD